jgi:hypothetical protein
VSRVGVVYLLIAVGGEVWRRVENWCEPPRLCIGRCRVPSPTSRSGQTYRLALLELPKGELQLRTACA